MSYRRCAGGAAAVSGAARRASATRCDSSCRGMSVKVAIRKLKTLSDDVGAPVWFHGTVFLARWQPAG